MKVGIVGGGLQGIELCYLCRAAGHDVLLADRRPDAPASGLADRFLQLDTEDTASLDAHLAEVEVIIPAFESRSGLAQLSKWASSRGVALTHDAEAFRISSSKLQSEVFFRDCGVRRPPSWPGCRFPVIAKPDKGSGSQGICIVENENDLLELAGRDPATAGWVVQAFLSGPTFSVEVIRHQGKAIAHQVTDLHMDAQYDCKRVTAPSILEENLQHELQALSIALADRLNLEGIMDVEVVLHQDQLYVLEIDARFPSQTPIAVFHSSGINLASSLVENATSFESTMRPDLQGNQSVVLEHIAVSTDGVRISGEHIMANADPLSHHHDFFDADEALTDYHPQAPSWVATLICTGTTPQDAWQRREQALRSICQHSHSARILDPEPSPIGKR